MTNSLGSYAAVFKQPFFMAQPFNVVNPVSKQPVFQSKMSSKVGLHPSLLGYDAAQSSGINVGWNRQGQADQVADFGKTVTYQWYAGKIDRDINGKLAYTPVEFGSLNLFPSDPVFQHINGLFGAMIIEPQGSTWECGESGNLADCEPSAAPPPTTRTSATVTLADKSTKFREFALMTTDDLMISDGTAVRSITARNLGLSAIQATPQRQPQTSPACCRTSLSARIPRPRPSRLRLVTGFDFVYCTPSEQVRLRCLRCMATPGSGIPT